VILFPYNVNAVHSPHICHCGLSRTNRLCIASYTPAFVLAPLSFTFTFHLTVLGNDTDVNIDTFAGLREMDMRDWDLQAGREEIGRQREESRMGIMMRGIEV
jgi:hypothetical protein